MSKQRELFFTYAHLRASDMAVFYIGKGLLKRITSSCNRNTHWRRTVAKHGLITQEVAAWESERDALDHEKFLIWCFRDMGVALTNLTSGGEGLSNPSKEVREKMSQNNPMKNPEIAEKNAAKRRGKGRRPLPAEAILKMATTKRGMKFSESHKASISLARKGIKFTQSHKDNISKSASEGAKKGWETRRKSL